MWVSEAQVLQFIAESPTKISFADLRRHFCSPHQLPPKQLKTVVARLIQSGQLSYTSHYGNSFIEISYDWPRRVSEHLVIKPPLVSLNLPSGQRAVSLQRGASFGGGEHPTTRMAIRLIDAILHTPPWTVKKQTNRGIDIGTGSGILAISAATMGLGSVCGIDTDPCALFEARENVGLNHLENRVHISNDRLDEVVGPYDVVLANLRAPTLMTLRDNVITWLSDPCVLILSGLKTGEIPLICDYYREADFFELQKLSEKGWSAICLARGAFKGEIILPSHGY